MLIWSAALGAVYGYLGTEIDIEVVVAIRVGRFWFFPVDQIKHPLKSGEANVNKKEIKRR